MERRWPQVVLNKKFATMLERKLPSHIDLGLILSWSVRASSIVFTASSEVAGRKNSLARRLSHWKALSSDEKVHSNLYFCFCREPRRKQEESLVNQPFTQVMATLQASCDSQKKRCSLQNCPSFPELNSFLYRPRLPTREVQMTKSGHCRCFLGARTRIRSV